MNTNICNCCHCIAQIPIGGGKCSECGTITSAVEIMENNGLCCLCNTNSAAKEIEAKTDAYLKTNEGKKLLHEIQTALQTKKQRKSKSI
jgi:hypothetical protein